LTIGYTVPNHYQVHGAIHLAAEKSTLAALNVPLTSPVQPLCWREFRLSRAAVGLPGRSTCARKLACSPSFQSFGSQWSASDFSCSGLGLPTTSLPGIGCVRSLFYLSRLSSRGHGVLDYRGTTRHQRAIQNFFSSEVISVLRAIANTRPPVSTPTVPDGCSSRTRCRSSKSKK
jgi:hypothetical protein